MKYVLLISITCLVLGLFKVNVYHNINLPQQYNGANRFSQSLFVDSRFPFIHTQYDIQMAQEIKDYDDIRDIDKVIQGANYGDVINFHLAGYGGSVNSVYSIIDNIDRGKAHVVMIVEAPVYSGHAYLAVNGDELIVTPFSYLMFHTSSEYDLDCSLQLGKDRNMTNEEHCNIEKQNDFVLFEQLLERSKILTEDEKNQLRNGKDIYLLGSTVKERQHVKNAMFFIGDVSSLINFLRAGPSASK